MGKLLGMLNTQNIFISSDILNLIAQIDEFKGAWRALGTLAPERLFALRRVATIESIGSSTRIASLANRNTVKVHLRKLVETGRLTKHGVGRGVWYQSA